MENKIHIQKTTHSDRVMHSRGFTTFSFGMNGMNTRAVKLALDVNGKFLNKNCSMFLGVLNNLFIEMKEYSGIAIIEEEGIALDGLPGSTAIQYCFELYDNDINDEMIKPARKIRLCWALEFNGSLITRIERCRGFVSKIETQDELSGYFLN